jgi:hypothetical protein
MSAHTIWTAAIALVFPAASYAVNINYSLDSAGPRIFRLSMAVTHVPAQEPLAAAVISCIPRQGIGITECLARAPADGAWSQIRPAVRQSTGGWSFFCVAPSSMAQADTSPVSMVSMLFTVQSSQPVARITDIFSLVTTDQTFDYWGVPVSASLPIVTATHTAVLPQTPFRPTLATAGRMHILTFNLLKRMPVHAMVVDARGKTVATLTRAILGPGVHSVRWNGLCAAGAPCGSGIYFIRFEAGTTVYTKKVRVQQ